MELLIKKKNVYSSYYSEVDKNLVKTLQISVFAIFVWRFYGTILTEFVHFVPSLFRLSRIVFAFVIICAFEHIWKYVQLYTGAEQLT